MQIGFDAKRAFHNNTGLGVYSRTLIRGLAETYPEVQQVLFNPRASEKYRFPYANCMEVRPSWWLHRMLPSFWRTVSLCADPAFKQLQVFHGLSNELPIGIEKSGVPGIVTIHDLIFEHFPKQYGRMDVEIYRYKFKSACARAKLVITPSMQTKEDIMQLYGTPEKNIRVVHNACDDRFYEVADEAKRNVVKQRYQLPDEYLLYVGSIIERKHLLSVCSALQHVGNSNLQLIVIGKGSEYKTRIQQFLSEKKLNHRVRFLEDVYEATQLNEDLPTIYQLSTVFIYPSAYEGFGLPVAEAMASSVPVITSSLSCLPEVGGDAAIYVNPADQDQLGETLSELFRNQALRRQMISRSRKQAELFRTGVLIQTMHTLYEEIAAS